MTRRRRHPKPFSRKGAARIRWLLRWKAAQPHALGKAGRIGVLIPKRVCFDWTVALLRSLEHLALARSWARLLTWARSRPGDVPDRLQFELMDRLWDGRPTIDTNHDVQPVHIVQATKGGHQTVRPFVRAHARDLLLYWALVDALQPTIEPALGAPDRICANRWTPIEEDVTPSRDANWSAFEDLLEQRAKALPRSFVLRGDISSFYMAIGTERLARVLLELGAAGSIVDDLRFLLTAWSSQGIRGLPQGLPPSGPLANCYLLFADEAVNGGEQDYFRYSDDIAIFCSDFPSARATLDRLERRLYQDGLTLGGDKTRVMRTKTLLRQLRPEGEQTNRAMRQFATDYEWEEGEIDEAERGIAIATFDTALAALSHDVYQRSEFIWALRKLGRFHDPHALANLEAVLLRLPGLTGEAMTYVASLKEDDRPTATCALERILASKFHREQEWLHVLRSFSLWPTPCSEETIALLARTATDHPHPLVRARAMIAWARKTPADESSLAETFFARERKMWQGYAVMAVRDKARREEIYARWSGEGRTVAQLIDRMRHQPIKWSKT